METRTLKETIADIPKPQKKKEVKIPAAKLRLSCIHGVQRLTHMEIQLSKKLRKILDAKNDLNSRLLALEAKERPVTVIPQGMSGRGKYTNQILTNEQRIRDLNEKIKLLEDLMKGDHK